MVNNQLVEKKSMKDQLLDTFYDVKDDPDKGIRLAESFIKKYYINDIIHYDVNVLPRSVKEASIEKNVKLYKINGIILNKDENNLNKLNNVYGALHSLGVSLVMLIVSDGSDIQFYLGTKVTDGIDVIRNVENVFEKSFKGNFPGSKLNSVEPNECSALLSDILPLDGNNAVTSLTGLPALKDDGTENNQYVQGIEKLLNTMKGEKYGIIIISDPVNKTQLANTKLGYEELYTQLAPLAGFEVSVGKSDAVSLTTSELDGFTKTIGKSVTKMQSFTKGKSTTKSESRTNTVGISLGVNGMSGTNSSNAVTKAKNGGLGIIVANAGMSVANAVTQGVMSAVGISGSVNASTAKTTGTAEQESSNRTDGIQQAEQDSTSTMQQTGKQEGISKTYTNTSTLQYENKSVKVLLEMIDAHLKRLKTCEDYGMWSSAAYFIAPTRETSVIATSAYKGIINGENSSLENSCINTWFKDEKVKRINAYLRKFIHPRFHDPEFLINVEGLADVSVTSMVSTKELSIQCGIPYKSVPGVPVREMAEFGRNIYDVTDNESKMLTIGKINHMGETDDKVLVELDVERLKEHTFITGSTGSGKSNTVYSIIDKLKRQYSIPTLVIEPAKGEYKKVFGSEYNVYGTNPKFTKLLRINPFKFDDDIHVLEHIDRLIDIFNVCWPMYAAMPAVLKEAVERAYISAGWNLDTSENDYDNRIFPCFKDVLRELRNVINESDYSQEVKNNYTGSLITRVKSLTNGLNGRIFVSNEIDNRKLFDESTIIDLSRVGSSETKSMLIGIIIIRLQEHRMSQGGINEPLKHITVLEEAHNLLKRTSTEQNSETANLLGKSVEMISNAIAEMRTYGEGFVIADQAPGLLDMSVIRNTNTKIILRLPDVSDRELVGKSAALNDNQLVELTKIPTGVAAIYQNRWIEPVLCKVDYFDNKPVEYKEPEAIIDEYAGEDVKENIIQYLLSDISNEESKNDVEQLRERLITAPIEAFVKTELLYWLNRTKPRDIEDISKVISDCFDTETVFALGRKAKNIPEWNEYLLEGLDFQMRTMSTICQQNILECLIREKAIEENNNEMSYTKWLDYMGRRG